MVSAHSIFARQWWAVALRTTRGVKASTSAERLGEFASEIAESTAGAIQKKPGVARRGVFVSAISEEDNANPTTASRKALLLFQTDRVYFPLAEDDLEVGTFGEADSGEKRDFPRKLVDQNRTVFQYPLFSAFSQKHTIGGVFVLASPYFMLLRDLMKSLELGGMYSRCIGIDVVQVFARLNAVKLRNGTVTVRAGRMLITGIPFIRSAVFFGDNVVASPLYTELIDKQNEGEDVHVDPKDCRIQRSYQDPVGGNRRAHVCWFDPHGNFRFTPGGNGDATLDKFFELLSVMNELDLIRDAETKNPLTRIGVR